MKSQTVTVMLSPPTGEKFYTFKRLSNTIGLDNQWVPVQFAAPGDVHVDVELTTDSYAQLRRHGDDCAPVTQKQFCKQTGIDEVLLSSFEVA